MVDSWQPKKSEALPSPKSLVPSQLSGKTNKRSVKRQKKSETTEIRAFVAKKTQQLSYSESQQLSNKKRPSNSSWRLNRGPDQTKHKSHLTNQFYE